MYRLSRRWGSEVKEIVSGGFLGGSGTWTGRCEDDEHGGALPISTEAVSGVARHSKTLEVWDIPCWLRLGWSLTPYVQPLQFTGPS